MLQDIVNGPFRSEQFDPVIDAYYQAFQDNGINVSNTTIVKTWVNDRRNYIISQLAALNTVFELTTNSGNDYSSANPFVTLNGTAPVKVDTITVNGFVYPITWSDITSWSITVGLMPGANALDFSGYDSFGNKLDGMTDSITVTYTGQAVKQPQPVINELQTDNSSGIIDNAGDHDPWIELVCLDETENTPYISFSETTESLSLAGYYLSDDLLLPTKWAFPVDITISNGEFMVVWADGELDESESGSLHTSFRLNTQPGSVYLSRISGSVTQVVDYVTYPPLATDTSYGSMPDGNPYSRLVMSIPTPGSSNISATRIIPVVINEWMSDNETTIADPADGICSDWFELYNPATQAVDLSGCVLSDGTDYWTIPENVTIPREGFMLIWADNQPDQYNGTNDLHAGFRLSRNGESIRISFEGATIDHIVFEAQSYDISHGRWTDGSNEIVMMFPPTPGEPNEIPEPVLAGILLAAGCILLRNRKA